MRKSVSRRHPMKVTGDGCDGNLPKLLSRAYIEKFCETLVITRHRAQTRHPNTALKGDFENYDDDPYLQLGPIRVLSRLETSVHRPAPRAQLAEGSQPREVGYAFAKRATNTRIPDLEH